MANTAHMFRSTLAFVLAAAAAAAFANPHYIIRYTEDNNFAGFASRYGLRAKAQIPGQPVYYVEDPLHRAPSALIARIDGDTDDDVSTELDQTVVLPERKVTVNQTSGAAQLERALANPSLTSFFAGVAHSGFVRQQAAAQVRAPQTWSTFGIGSGLVAVIDTGVDQYHPFLRPVLVPGIDLLAAGGTGSELTGLPANLLAILNPTTTPLLMRQRLHSNPTTTPLLEGPVAAFFRVNSIPRALGHGTMVAGAVRLTAPGARILPVRAFTQDGAASLWNVLRGIYASQARGARVINLSLNTLQYSPELHTTVEQLSDQGIILVASAGNDGLTNVPSYPASLPKVTGVASVSSIDVRSRFSNAGAGVSLVSAPGEALLLPFPGGRWAGGWGTSFAAPLVSGLAAQLIKAKPETTYSDLQSSLGKSRILADPALGFGRLDLYESVAAFR